MSALLKRMFSEVVEKPLHLLLMGVSNAGFPYRNGRKNSVVAVAI